MKIIIIGAVASGTSAGAKARRNDENATITIYEKDSFISYSGCGMPYFIGDEVESIDSLTPREPSFFKKKYNIDVLTQMEVISVDNEAQSVEVKNLLTGEVFSDNYDKLVLATGATPVIPDISGVDLKHVFALRNIRDVLDIKQYLNSNKPKTAVVVGSGFIGFEVLENLLHLGIKSQLVESKEQITPNLDSDIARYFEGELLKRGVVLHTNTTVTQIEGDTVTLSSGHKLSAEIVILATGVKPNTTLAKQIGVELGLNSAIKVDSKMQTNIQNIYACGDCIETYCTITNKAVYRPLGSTANKTGRIAGDVVTGGMLEYKGNLGTSIFKFKELTIASTGLTQKQAEEYGYEVQVCHNIKPNKSEYLGGEEMLIKGIADTKTLRILGVQIIGGEGVDKRIDVFATLITYKATVDELFHLDLAYAPPFSTTKDPVHYTGMILDNAINTKCELITTAQLEELQAKGEELQIVDTRSPSDFEKKGSVKNAVNIPQAQLRDDDLPLNKGLTTVTFCNKGVTGNASQNILLNRGFRKVYNLSGGHRFYKSSKGSLK